MTVARRGFRGYDLHVRRLAVISFNWVVRAIRADNSVLDRNCVPQVSFWTGGCSNPMHVDGKPIGVKRLGTYRRNLRHQKPAADRLEKFRPQPILRSAPPEWRWQAGLRIQGAGGRSRVLVPAASSCSRALRSRSSTRELPRVPQLFSGDLHRDFQRMSARFLRKPQFPAGCIRR